LDKDLELRLNPPYAPILRVPLASEVELKPLDNEKAEAFSSFFLQCFEDTLSQILGEGAKTSLLECLEKHKGLKRDEMGIQFDVLRRCLKEIFGEAAIVLERMIARQIYRKLALDTPPEDFEAAIEQAEQAYMNATPNLLVSR